MATGDSQTTLENLEENLTNMLQRLNTTCADLENAAVTKTKGSNLLKTMKSAIELLKKITIKAEKCENLCEKIQNQQESAMKRRAVLMEDRDSGFTGSGLYTQESGEEDVNLIVATEDEEFHSAEEPSSSNGEEDS
ncbi:hypothetical protein ACJMK2_033995 [Sinanodonta woodiana]|uniref:Uncharacterized protein n=1 Tax=Sinanodonta woodiana TaxID=1069815 RepID=A0ABD3WQ78_SINWO